MRFRNSALWPLAFCAASACSTNTHIDGAVCDAHIDIRVPAVDPFFEPDNLTLAWAEIKRAGVQAHAGTVELFGLQKGGVSLLITSDGTDTPPPIEPGDEFIVSLGAYNSVSGTSTLAAFGSTTPFSCLAGEQPTIPIYVGPAQSFGAFKNRPQLIRSGAKVLPWGADEVLIVGGDDHAASPSVPGAMFYDHRTGAFCGSAEGCFATAPPALIGHTLNLTSDGGALLIGGANPATGAVSSAVLHMASGSGSVGASFTELPFAGSVGPRFSHATVVLEGQNVPPSQRGKVLVVGGCADTCTGTDVYDNAILIDLDGQQTEMIQLPDRGTNQRRLYDATATMLSSGEIIIAGGRDDTGALLSTVHIYDTRDSTWSTPTLACPDADIAPLCGARAGHEAVLLDDGNLLLVGGEVAAVSGVADAPAAEVYLLEQQRVVPANGDIAAAHRVGHSVVRLHCGEPPCDVLVVGGKDVTSGNATVAPILYSAASTGVAEFGIVYEGSSVTLDHPDALRDGAASAPLSDGTALIIGGPLTVPAPSSFAPVVIFTPCRPLGDLSCPGQ